MALVSCMSLSCVAQLGAGVSLKPQLGSGRSLLFRGLPRRGNPEGPKSARKAEAGGPETAGSLSLADDVGQQAEETGASTVVSACPFCLTMMKDGLDLTGATEEKGMVVEDLAELVVKHLDWTPPEPEVPEDEGTEDGAGEEMVWVG